MTDAAHCGDCDQACSAGQTCNAGKCEDSGCTPPDVSCLGDCVDLLTHVDHCGGCEQPCTNGEVCVNGDCSPDCPEGWEMCGDVCVDTNADTTHCGGCDKPCGDGEECASGVCQCTQGTEACANSCVDTSIDLKHCGKCDNACSAGANATVACLMGTCNATCNKGFDDCSANLPGCETNLTNNLQNCGKCSNPCPNVTNGTPECKASSCGIASCDKGYDNCDSNDANGCEANLYTDDKNCGQCKYDCGVGNYCDGGNCKTIPSGPFSQTSYSAVMTFKDQLASSTMGIAWDGTNLWSCSGGSSNGERLAQYTASGSLVKKYSPGIDFRSVYTKGDGNNLLWARGYASMIVRVQTSPGVFGNNVKLAGSIDSQGAVVWDDKSSNFVAHKDAIVYRWMSSGAALTTLSLSGYGTQNNESNGPQDSNVAAAGGYYLTYSEGVLSAWYSQGSRVDTTKLTSAGTSSDSHYGFSYAQGKVWVIDNGGGTWRGYDVGL